MPSDEVVDSLLAAVPCREAQIRYLATVFAQPNHVFSPSTTVIYGVNSTGKTLAIRSVLKSCNPRHAIVQSADWVDPQELLQAVISAIGDIPNLLQEEEEEERGEEEVHQRGDDVSSYFTGGCETISSFVVQLQLLLESKGHITLVFDGIDKQRAPWPTLLPAIARLGEIIDKLSVILVVTASPALLFHLTGAPHVHFTPYTRAESIRILASSPLPLGNVPKVEADRFWTNFCGIVWDSLGKTVARDIVAFRDTCTRIWEPFVQPIVQGDYAPCDMHKLVIKHRALLQGDQMIEPEITPWTSGPSSPSTEPDKERKRPIIPILTSHFIIAAYLASHTPSRTDCLRFSKVHKSKRSRKPRSGVSKRSRGHRKIPCHLVGPSAFQAERLFAIYQAILPPDLYGKGMEANLDEALALLWGSKLILKCGGEDVMGCKWRIGFGLEFILALAKDAEFDLDGYLWD